MRLTVLPEPTVLVAYAATGETIERFDPSPDTTLTSVSVDASEIVAAVVRSYVRVEGTVSVPPTVSWRWVMFAVAVPVVGNV